MSDLQANLFQSPMTILSCLHFVNIYVYNIVAKLMEYIVWKPNT